MSLALGSLRDTLKTSFFCNCCLFFCPYAIAPPKRQSFKCKNGREMGSPAIFG